MEVFLERLLFELAAIAVQVAILQLIRWLQGRSAERESTVILDLAA